MLVEAGPNPERHTLVLDARDPAGRSVARVRFRDRRRIYLPLPDVPDAELGLRLTVVPSRERRWGPTQLQLRVFECGWATSEELQYEGIPAEPAEASAVAVRDIFDLGAGITLHGGWGGRSWTPDGRLFRELMGSAAFSAYTATLLPGRLALDLEFDQPAQVRVRTPDDVVAAVLSASGGQRHLVISPPPATREATRFIIESTRIASGEERTTGLPARIRVYGLRRTGLGPSLRALLRPLARRVSTTSTPTPAATSL